MSVGGGAKTSISSEEETTNQTVLGTTEEESRETTTGTRSGVEQLVLEQEAIDKIIQDVLGGAGGLAEIFAGEQTAGIFDSSVAAQSSGDLASKLVGEIAKLTGKTEKSETFEAETDVLATQISEQLTRTRKKTVDKDLETEASGKFGF